MAVRLFTSVLVLWYSELKTRCINDGDTQINTILSYSVIIILAANSESFLHLTLKEEEIMRTTIVCYHLFFSHT